MEEKGRQMMVFLEEKDGNGMVPTPTLRSFEKTSYYFAIAHGRVYRELSDKSPHYPIEPMVHGLCDLIF